jgi:hypothetical protein
VLNTVMGGHGVSSLRSVTFAGRIGSLPPLCKDIRPVLHLQVHMQPPSNELCLQNGAVGGIVIHVQHTHAAQRRRGKACCHISAGPFGQADSKPEGAALVGSALDPNRPRH